ncbi:MAG: hypothetical protein AAF514_17450, partial [Verrucomicrobiota bacterium]
TKEKQRMKLKTFASRSISMLAIVGAFSYAQAGDGSYGGAMGGVAPAAPAPSGIGAAPAPLNALGGGAGLLSEAGFEIGLGYDTDYIFRGYDLGHDFLWASLDLVLNPTDQFEFNLGTWYTNGFNEGASEIDIYGGVGFNWNSFNVGVGLTHYAYPDGRTRGGQTNGGETNEAYLTLGNTYSVGNWSFDTTLAYYYDFDLENHFVELSAETAYQVTDSLTVVPAFGISYASFDVSGAEGVNHAFASLSLPLALTANATLTPYVATSVALDVAENSFGENDYFWGGVSLSVSF